MNKRKIKKQFPIAFLPHNPFTESRGIFVERLKLLLKNNFSQFWCPDWSFCCLQV